MEKVEKIGLGELTFLFQLVGPQTKIRGEIIPSRTRIPRSVQGSGHFLALRLRYRGSVAGRAFLDSSVNLDPMFDKSAVLTLLHFPQVRVMLEVPPADQPSHRYRAYLVHHISAEVSVSAFQDHSIGT